MALSMTGNRNYRAAGTSADGPWEVSIDAHSAGWSFSGIGVLVIQPGGSATFATEDREVILVPLEGSFDVLVDGEPYALAGRSGVFASATDVLYVPRDSEIVVSSTGGGRVAVPSARARRRLPVQHLPAGDVPTSIRGAGVMSRKIRDFGGVAAIQADRLIACEVITPGGNWSSYPPHKHDEATEHESELEEIYYYEVADGPAGAGVAYQRVSSSDDRNADLLEEVRSGDVVLIPFGWHGPAMAAPGHDLYYLNVMAGPADDRSWLITDHPDVAWIRNTWADLAPDARLI